MIDQDYKFFRQNFSAASFSKDIASKEQSYFLNSQSKAIQNNQIRADSKHVTKNQKELSYQTKNITTAQNQAQKSLKVEGKSRQNWTESGKQVQLKILQKLKSQHKGIKSLNSQEGLPQARYEQQKLDLSMNQNATKKISSNQNEYVLPKQTNKPKPVQATNQQIKQSRQLIQLKQNSKQAYRQLQQFKQSRTKEISIYEQKITTFNYKIQSLSKQVQQKQVLIKRLRTNQAALEEKYTNEVREFQSQLQDSIQTISNLRKQLLLKDNEIDELRQNNRMMSSNTQLFQLQQQLVILKNKQKGYKQTIERLQLQNMNDNYPGISTYVNNRDTTTQIAAQITRLRQTLTQREQKWNQKLTEAIQKQRKNHLIQLQKLITKQGPISFGSQERIQHVTSRQQVLPTLDRLVAEVQELKRVKIEASNSSSITQQLKFIKQFITRLQKNEKEISHHSSDGQSPDTTQLLKTELSNYKKFILEEQKSKRAFLEELNLYRSQNLEIINQNTYLRHQLGTIQHHMDNSPADNSKYIEQINTLRIQMQQQTDKIEQYEYQVTQLHNQLVNSQPQRPMILNKSQDLQLHNQIQRLHHIMQAQSQYFIKVNTQITQYFESQINLYEQRVRLYQQSIRATQHYLQQNESRLHQLSSRHMGDSNSIIQSNQLFQHEAVQFRNELSGLMTTNRQIQTQIREQSQTVDEIWRAKQEQLHKEMLMIERLKGHHQQ